MLEIKGISKSYDGQPLLRGISFRVRTGETLCLLGASGSGKSTLLRIIAGLEPADSGEVFFDGVNIDEVPAHARDFGLVFQDYMLFPHLNVFDNVAFGLRMHGFVPHALEQRVAELLAQVSLEGFELRKTNQLSGGEQQRVALARALAAKPRLLMFDEPLGALDRSLKEDLLSQLRSILRKTKIPAIYVTHDQQEALAIADRVLLLHDGGIVRAGKPADVWAEPGSAWAARFLAVGQVFDGEMLSAHRVRSDVGTFELKCAHIHVAGERVALLARETSKAAKARTMRAVRLKVKDVQFDGDGFQVHASLDGAAHARAVILLKRDRSPRIGESIRAQLEVECLGADPEEESRR